MWCQGEGKEKGWELRLGAFFLYLALLEISYIFITT
jgi:hypothetical protein